MKDIFLKIKEILSAIPQSEGSSKRLFPTVKLDKGQFERIINNNQDTEFGYKFPAVFIRFTNVAYTSTQNRISEGTGIMRIRFVLDRLNDQDDEYETEIFDYFGIINAAIQDAKATATELQKRCSLSYFDMPESTNQLQPCWIDYDVQFYDTTGEKYREWVDRKITTPMFTNRSDVEDDDRPDITVDGYEDQVTLSDSID